MQLQILVTHGGAADMASFVLTGHGCRFAGAERPVSTMVMRSLSGRPFCLSALDLTPARFGLQLSAAAQDLLVALEVEVPPDVHSIDIAVDVPPGHQYQVQAGDGVPVPVSTPGRYSIPAVREAMGVALVS